MRTVLWTLAGIAAFALYFLGAGFTAQALDAKDGTFRKVFITWTWPVAGPAILLMHSGADFAQRLLAPDQES